MKTIETTRAEAIQAALRIAAQSGSVTISEMLRKEGVPYGVGARALEDMRTIGILTGPDGDNGERFMIVEDCGVAS